MALVQADLPAPDWRRTDALAGLAPAVLVPVGGDTDAQSSRGGSAQDRKGGLARREENDDIAEDEGTVACERTSVHRGLRSAS